MELLQLKKRTVAVPLTDAEWKRLKRYLQDAGMTRGGFVRNLILERMAKNGDD